MTDVMIEARDLTKRYGPVRAIDKVSFEVRKGEVLGFLGPNGAGKTTTMKILTTFIAPTEGSARVNGLDVFEDPLSVRRAIGYLPESTPLYVEMMVLEYLEFVAKVRGLEGDEARKRIKKVVEQTGLGDVIAKEIRALSKGYRQRTGLAQALIHEPPILILDEPMSGLDPNQATEIRELIREIGRERTVILSTHNLAEVQLTCKRVLIIARGRIVADDTTQDLSDRAGRTMRFVATFLRDTQGGYRDQDNAHAVRDVLGKIDGVDRVRQISSNDEKEIAFELMPLKNEDLRAGIFKAAVQGNFTMVELRRESQNLEQIFRELTIGEDGEAVRANGKSGEAKAATKAKGEPAKPAAAPAKSAAEPAKPAAAPAPAAAEKEKEPEPEEAKPAEAPESAETKSADAADKAEP